MIESKKRAQLLETFLEEYPFLDSKYVPPDNGSSNEPKTQWRQTKGINYK
jgi:hypothetical protein